MIKRQVTLGQLVTTVWEGRWVVAAITCVAVFAGVAYALTRKPLYQSEALLAPATAESSQLGALSAVAGQFAGIGSLLGLAGMQQTDVEEAVAVLRSRQFTDSFLRKNGVRRHLFPDRWDSASNSWRKGSSRTRELDGGPSIEDSYKRFNALRDVTIDRRTNYVRLAIRAPTPELAQAWATATIADLNESMRMHALQEARLSVDLLAKRMATEQIDSIRNTSATLLESQMQRQVVAEVRKEFALRVLDPPSLPEQRVYPRRTRMVGIAFLIGAILGCASLLAWRAWTARASGTPAR